MRRVKDRPLIERDEKEIQREMAEYLGMPKDAIRVTKAELSDGRQVAYIRAVWKREKEKETMGNKYIQENSTCMYCGAPTRMHALVCKRCRDLGVMPRRPKTDNESKISAVAREAWENHRLSYGQHVAILYETNKQ